jgi:hypothetical protein
MLHWHSKYESPPQHVYQERIYCAEPDGQADGEEHKTYFKP